MRVDSEPWEYAIDRWLKDEFGRLQFDLLAGGPKDYPTYRELVGQIRGIQNCMNELISIRERLANPDGDVDRRES